MSGDRERCLAAGMDDYLSKPLHKADLLQALYSTTESGVDESAAKTESPPDAPQLVDWAAALRAMGGDSAILRTVIHAVLEETPNLIVELQEALAQEDEEAVCRHAHAIAGTMRPFGAASVIALATAIERKAKADELPDAQRIFAELYKQLEQAANELRTF